MYTNCNLIMYHNITNTLVLVSEIFKQNAEDEHMANLQQTDPHTVVDPAKLFRNNDDQRQGDPHYLQDTVLEKADDLTFPFNLTTGKLREIFCVLAHDVVSYSTLQLLSYWVYLEKRTSYL